MLETTLHQRYTYDEVTGNLYYRVRFPETSGQSQGWCDWFNEANVGKPVGSLNGDGYISFDMFINGKRKTLSVHRVVWLLFYGVWPTNTIDHLNKIRGDNRITNLADKTHKENHQNKSRMLETQEEGVIELGGTWVPYVKNSKGNKKHLGSYPTKHEALLFLADYISKRS